MREKRAGALKSLATQSSYEGITEMGRRMRRGNEEARNPNQRDVAGAEPDDDAPEGRKARDTPANTGEG